MKKHHYTSALIITMLLLTPVKAEENETRQTVNLPEMMRQHMLGNMRDHLLSVHQIQEALARGDLEKAGDIAESRLGMSSLASHNAEHMAPFMPASMQQIGTEMHHAASRFAITAREGDLKASLSGLAKVTQQCIACHSSFKIN
ncbi:cytochrome c [Sulfurirhabdus autotrophica]|uniref:Cytochrome c n=1 Tax=Sulfurirhabdus autotrophica TaxID=1706046 RepID=A0A4R3YE95_9PROT|nr:cytochrome c [Sulfurirhabdus autotrophica]TCV90241.1 cytochrome c' [Sulfurirhabdus autotrophica]